MFFSYYGRKMACVDSGTVYVYPVQPDTKSPEPEYSFPIDRRFLLAVSDMGDVALFRKPSAVVIKRAQGEESFTHKGFWMHGSSGVTAKFVPWPVAEFDEGYRVKRVGDEYLVVCRDDNLWIFPGWLICGNEGTIISLVDGKQKTTNANFSGMEIDDNGWFIAAIENKVMRLPPVGDLDIGFVILSLPYPIGKITRRDNLLAVWCRNGAVYISSIDKKERVVAEIGRGVFNIAWQDDTLVLLHRPFPPLLSFVTWNDITEALRKQEKNKR